MFARLCAPTLSSSRVVREIANRLDKFELRGAQLRRFPRFFFADLLSHGFSPAIFGTPGHQSPVSAFFLCAAGGSKEDNNEETGPIFNERTSEQLAQPAPSHSWSGRRGAATAQIHNTAEHFEGSFLSTGATIGWSVEDLASASNRRCHSLRETWFPC